MSTRIDPSVKDLLIEIKRINENTNPEKVLIFREQIVTAINEYSDNIDAILKSAFSDLGTQIDSEILSGNYNEKDEPINSEEDQGQNAIIPKFISEYMKNHDEL